MLSTHESESTAERIGDAQWRSKFAFSQEADKNRSERRVLRSFDCRVAQQSFVLEIPIDHFLGVFGMKGFQDENGGKSASVKAVLDANKRLLNVEILFKYDHGDLSHSAGI